MNRRSFIGSVIGTFVASKLPFYAKAAPIELPKTISSKLARIKKIIDLFEKGEEEVKLGKTYFELGDGSLIDAPSIINVKIEDLKIIIQLDPFEVKTNLTIVGAIYYSKENIMITKSLFSMPLNVVPSDTVNLSLTINVNI